MAKLHAKEQDILNSILDYLEYRHILVAHIRNTGVIIRRGNKTFFGRSKRSRPGIPDILGVYKGKPIAIEVKSEVGHVSPEQTAWLSQWSNNGGFFCIARSVDHVDTFIKALGGE